MVKKLKSTKGITLVSLVITIIILLILAAIAIIQIEGNGLLKKSEQAEEKTRIAELKERIETNKDIWTIDKQITPSITINDLWKRLVNENILADEKNAEGPEVDDNGNEVYILNTTEGYVVEIIVNEGRNIDIGDIEKGGFIPIIKKIETSSTERSITAKAIVTRLKNGTIEYYYKLLTEDDSKYKKMTNINDTEGATAAENIIDGTTYIVKVIAKNDAGKKEETAQIMTVEESIAFKVEVSSLTSTRMEAKCKCNCRKFE